MFRHLAAAMLMLACTACVDQGTVTIDPAEHHDDPVVDPGSGGTTPGGQDVTPPAASLVADMAQLSCVPYSDERGAYTEWRVVIEVPDLDTAYAPKGYDQLALVADVFMPDGFDGASSPCWSSTEPRMDPSHMVQDPGDVGIAFLPRVATSCRDEDLVGVPYAEARVHSTDIGWVTFAVTDEHPPVAPKCELPDRYQTI